MPSCPVDGPYANPALGAAAGFIVLWRQLPARISIPALRVLLAFSMVPKTVPTWASVPVLLRASAQLSGFGETRTHAEESLAEVMSRRSLAMDTVEAAQSLKSGALFSSECEDSRMIGMTPMSVADRSSILSHRLRSTSAQAEQIKVIIFGMLSQPKAVLNVIRAAAEDS